MALVTCKNQEKYPLFSSFKRKKSFQSSQFSKCILGYYFSVVFQAIYYYFTTEFFSLHFLSQKSFSFYKEVVSEKFVVLLITLLLVLSCIEIPLV